MTAREIGNSGRTVVGHARDGSMVQSATRSRSMDFPNGRNGRLSSISFNILGNPFLHVRHGAFYLAHIAPSCVFRLDSKTDFVNTCPSWKRPAKMAKGSLRSPPNDQFQPSPGASARMARIRQAKTKPESQIASILRLIGLSYRRNVRSLPGSPDFANKTKRWAIFVNGCYWHHHTACKRATLPKANRSFWLEKFTANRRRDAKAIGALRRIGFKVAVVWECEAESQETRLRQVLEPGGV